MSEVPLNNRRLKAYTRIPEQETRNPEPKIQIRNPKSGTQNPKSETRKPELSSRFKQNAALLDSNNEAQVPPWLSPSHSLTLRPSHPRTLALPFFPSLPLYLPHTQQQRSPSPASTSLGLNDRFDSKS